MVLQSIRVSKQSMNEEQEMKGRPIEFLLILLLDVSEATTLLPQLKTLSSFAIFLVLTTEWVNTMEVS